MMLQRLKEYAERTGAVQPAGYAMRRIKWQLALDEDGRLLGVMNLASAISGPEAAGMAMPAPQLVRAAGDRALLLADTGEYALGRPGRGDAQRKQDVPFDPHRARRVDNRHQLFRELAQDCARQTGERSVEAVCRFLDRLPAFDHAADLRDLGSGVSLPADFEFGDQLTFSCGDQRPIDLPPVRDFWQRHLGGVQAAKGVEGQCQVCGARKPLLARMPMTIKGIPGGQPSGNALISANSPAFESYGLANSLIAGTCRDCAEAFHAGLQTLISNQRTSLRDAAQVTVFWTRADGDVVDLGIVEQPTEEAVRGLFQSVQSGRRASAEAVRDPRDFYCLSLAASGSRIAVQSWLETSVEEAKRNLLRYFALQRLARAPRQAGVTGAIGPPVRLWALQRSLLRSHAPGRDLPAKGVRLALLKTALTGARLPDGLLTQAVRRCQLEQGVSYDRAVLIKMILSQRSRKEGTSMADNHPAQEDQTAPEGDPWQALDLGYASPGYLCGRALAILDQIQHTALPNVKSTLADRYFTGASQSPNTVLPRLIQNARNHLGKLRDQPAGFALEMRLGEILSGLKAQDGFPPTLTYHDQGEFCLGYYHQREDGFLQARLRKEQRAAASNERKGE